MVAVSIVVLSLLGVFVSTHIRSGLYEDRQTQILSDASRRFAATQLTFDKAAVTSVDQVQDVAYQAMLTMRSSAEGAGGVGTFLLRSSADAPEQSINEVVEPGLRGVISDEMRQAVRDNSEYQWQAVALPRGNNLTDPGIVVGTTLNLPIVGSYEAYIVYTLAPEEATVKLVMQVLLVGSITLLLLFTGMIWAVSYQIMLPITRTAQAAKKLTNGDLSARVLVKGDDELAVLGESFNNMADSLQAQIWQYSELARLQQRFVSDVSHELRTPLTTIRMATDMIHDSKDELPALPRRSAELLHEQVDRFDNMLADLLEISRFDAQTAQLVREDHDLVKLIRRVIADNQILADNNGVKVVFDPTQIPCVAEVDERRIERIVRNLLVNAYEHAEGKPVHVELAANASTVAIRVRDFGVGMSDEVASHVFDRFYRADPARPRTTGGTGLGLAICAEDAHLHQGSLEAIGCPHSGSAFRLLIPVKANEPMGQAPLELTDEELTEARQKWAEEHPEDIQQSQTAPSVSLEDTASHYEEADEEDYESLDLKLAEEQFSDEVDHLSPSEHWQQARSEGKSQGQVKDETED